MIYFREAISTEEPQISLIEEHIRTLSRDLKEFKNVQHQATAQIETLKQEKSALDDKLVIMDFIKLIFIVI